MVVMMSVAMAVRVAVVMLVCVIMPGMGVSV
jgi:hypothetical protein